MQRPLVLITGLSGSGKSTVAKCFEDLGYYCVDNLPLSLLERFLAAPREHVAGEQPVAVVTDVRAPGFAAELPRMIRKLETEGNRPVVLFLEASDSTLVRRFSETRRPHPLAGEMRVPAGIRRERRLLTEVRGLADRIIDTSELSIHEIRREVYREFAGEAGREPTMVISLVSFGFKYGTPQGLDLLFDVRFLPNPHFVPGLAEQTGRDAAVREYLEAQHDYGELTSRLLELLLFLLPRFDRENRSYLSLAVGCTGGRHRSVAVAERLATALREAGWRAQLSHRDIER